MEFKCKMCGGNLHVDENSTIATCEYCGTTQTVPHIDSEKTANMKHMSLCFNRRQTNLSGLTFKCYNNEV